MAETNAHKQRKKVKQSEYALIKFLDRQIYGRDIEIKDDASEITFRTSYAAGIELRQVMDKILMLEFCDLHDDLGTQWMDRVFECHVVSAEDTESLSTDWLLSIRRELERSNS